MNIVDPILNLIGGEFASTLAGMSVISILVRIFLSLFMSVTVGFERSSKKQPAGLKTYVLVCIGATIIMITDQFLRLTYGSGDGSRLSAAVITGVGFLGAGAIIFTSRGKVKGLTTAAGIWAMACVGLTVGAGLYTAGIIGYIVVLLVFTIFPYLETKYIAKKGCLQIYVELLSRPNLKDLITFLRDNKVEIDSTEYNPAYANSGLSVYTLTIDIDKNHKHFKNHEKLIEEIRKLDYVNYVEEI